MEIKKITDRIIAVLLRSGIRDKRELLLATDEVWKVHAGQILMDDLYDGEVWDMTAPDGAEMPVQVLEESADCLKARLSLPVKVQKLLPVKEVIFTPAGETVLDMGQNFAGFVRYICREPKGTRIHFQFGEILQKGNFYNANLRTAKAEYTYISDGQERVVEPHFTYFGFRYVKVEGIQKIHAEDFVGCASYSELEEVSSLKTDHSDLNQLISNAFWGQRSNYVDNATDCPQRDERMGCTGDTQVFSGTACFNMDSYAFLNKYLYDSYRTQKQYGHMTNTIPAFEYTVPTTAAWGDVTTIVPWNLYLFYGDSGILEQQYESMKLWVAQIKAEDEAQGGRRLWEAHDAFGDWLALDSEDPGERYFGGTDTGYVSTVYYYHSACLTGKAARVLGQDQEAQEYETLAQEIREAFLDNYFTKTGRLAVDTQTGYVLALYFGLYPEGAKEQLVKGLRKKLENNNGYLKTGFVGTPYLNPVLSENGLNNMAYRLLLNEEVPSWLYPVKMGATTIWERWNAVLPDGTVNGTDMTSLNHYAYGSVLEWIYRYVAGLNPVEQRPGFKRAVIAPRPYRWINQVDYVYHSAAGIYEIHWKKDKEYFELQITVPFDAEAEVVLPYGKEKVLVGAGSHSWRIPLKDEEPFYHVDCSFAMLMEDPEACAILDEEIPGWRLLPVVLKENSIRAQEKAALFATTIKDGLKTLDQKLRGIR